MYNVNLKDLIIKKKVLSIVTIIFNKYSIKWVLFFMQSEQFSAILWREQITFLMRSCLWPSYTRPTRWDGYPAEQSTGKHVAPLGTLFCLPANQSLLLFLNAACEEEPNIKFVVFGLNRLGIKTYELLD